MPRGYVVHRRPRYALRLRRLHVRAGTRVQASRASKESSAPAGEQEDTTFALNCMRIHRALLSFPGLF